MNNLIGKKVICSQKIGKRIRINPKRTSNSYNNEGSKWEIENIEQVSGIICGKRIKQDGKFEYFDAPDSFSGGCYFFEVKNFIPCYLVAISMNQTILTPIETCTLINT